jgi:hypothetical protein
MTQDSSVTPVTFPSHAENLSGTIMAWAPSRYPFSLVESQMSNGAPVSLSVKLTVNGLGRVPINLGLSALAGKEDIWRRSRYVAY